MQRQPRARRARSWRTTGATRHRHTLCERLEPRFLLTGDTNYFDHSSNLAIQSAAEHELLATSAIRASDAGSTFATAFDLGQLKGRLVLSGSVGGSDPSDLVRFTLTGTARVDVGLSGLASDIDLALYNSSGQRIGLSNRSGAAAESISQTLQAGVYYVAVTPWLRAASAYVLSLGATFTQPTTPTNPAPTNPPTTTPTPTNPTPTNPTTPSTPGTAFPDVAYFGGSNEWGLNAINAPEAWARGYKGQGAVVAVVDTGVDLNHPDLMSQLWVNADEIAGNGIDDDHNGYVDDRFGWDFASGDNNPDDGNGHGTHVAGIIAADDNGFGSTGVAPDATIMPVRVLGNDGSGSAAAVAAGIRYAAQNGADIINLSLGGALSSVIQSAIQYAQQLNVLVVVAAGNESASAPSYPARFSASMANVLSVGAHSSSGAIASFSNHVGTSGAVQVDAPGVNVYSTYIDGRYANLSGTSMATPYVAGLAALALSANANLSATQLRSLIVQGANRAISGSDARGGVNAALTVALAAAGQVSTSAVPSAAPRSQPTAQLVAVRRFAIRSIAMQDDAFAVANMAQQSTSPQPDAERGPTFASAPAPEPMREARNQALLAAGWADELDLDRVAGDAGRDFWLDLQLAGALDPSAHWIPKGALLT
jgi:subtilisin family serine protease